MYFQLIIISIGTIGFFFIRHHNINEKNKIQLHHKMVQTDIIVKEYIHQNIQCDIDLTEMRESGDLEIITNPSSNYRWFIYGT